VDIFHGVTVLKENRVVGLRGVYDVRTLNTVPYKNYSLTIYLKSLRTDFQTYIFDELCDYEIENNKLEKKYQLT